VVGQRWRASVTPAGVVEPHDGTRPLRWAVAAEDRWHDPVSDAGVRHRRISGTAAFETKMRIPGGDAVQRVWSVADRGGYTLVSVDNDSPAPIAVAFSRGDVATARPPVPVPTGDVELPTDAVVLPVGHRSSVIVGLAHAARPSTVLPTGLPDVGAVVRGWVGRTDVASRLELPEASLVESVRAVRCELLLGARAEPAEPERYLLCLSELVRLGELGCAAAIEIAADVAAAVDSVARRGDFLGTAALDAAAVVLSVAGERRAVADLARLRAATADGATVGAGSLDEDDGVAVIPVVERLVAAGPTLFPRGIPDRWQGQDLEVHRLVVGPDSRLSLAMRWHGPNAAVLWEVDGPTVTLTATVGAAWSSSAARGETLWQPSRGGRR
jgi:hypothetical protein